jgi:acyl carrier protein
MDRTEALAIINAVLAKKGRGPVRDDDTTLREAGLRSLDFSETILRVEDRLGREIGFGATTIWRVRTISDAVDLFTRTAGADADPVQ